jgi:hypothetical protein
VIEHPPHDNLADLGEARLNGWQMQDGFGQLPRPGTARMSTSARAVTVARRPRLRIVSFQTSDRSAQTQRAPV